ncbi:MAG: pseudaminic acid synthase [Candidatus Pacebacteria bacterium]|nr:pseudaminic acid synthase [Candidatus Paceibacterota bacterium]
MDKTFKIGKRLVGEGQPVFIVAEMSGNHNQSYEKAVEIVKAAAAAGADAVKLQTYTPDTITLNSDKEWFLVGGENNPDNWKKKTLYQLYKEDYMPWDWQPKLKKLANDLGMELFSTPFDQTAVDFLEKMDVPCYKVASYEATDFLLLRKIAKTGKPVIMSVGYAPEEEVRFALKTLRDNGAKDIAILHCVTGYSDNPVLEEMNLRTIKDISEKFEVVGGFSDNNAGTEIPVMAALSGAAIIEKHLIISRKDGGPDPRFSVEPAEMKKMIEEIRRAEKALGKIHYGTANQTEEYNKRFRRSLFVSKDIKKGETFTAENIRSVRPAFGLETKYFDEIVGKKATKDIEFGTPLSWEMVDKNS